MVAVLNLAHIERQLCPEGQASPGDLEWLGASYGNPEAFWLSLQKAQSAYFTKSAKSTPYVGYDFYHDIVCRNQEREAPALRQYDSLHGWRELSYEDLGRGASQRSSDWIGAGALPGQTLCIIDPFGEQFLISLLAALKTGLVISLLPPQGRGFLERRLANLVPDYIDSDISYLPLLESWKDRILPRGTSGVVSDVALERSYSYSSGRALGMLFNPCSRTPDVPVELMSDQAYLCPLRDGMIALGLRPGLAYAAPGFHFLQSQPAMLLSGLLNGATFVHLDPDDISRQPDLLLKHPLRAMGVSTFLRDKLLQVPLDGSSAWDIWFRDPAESMDIDQWQSFIKATNLQDVRSCNLRWESAFGGCSLFSIRRKGQADLNALPSAGIPWSLADPAETGIESGSDFGLLSLSPIGGDKSENRLTADMIARKGKEWLFAGARVFDRRGRHYPKEEVLEAIWGGPGCPCCSICEVPAQGASMESLFSLLVFTAGADLNEAETAQRIDKSIERELGREFLPDRIRFFPLHPRQVSDGGIDHEWCQSEYISGGLFRRSRDDICLALSVLRERVMRS